MNNNLIQMLSLMRQLSYIIPPFQIFFSQICHTYIPILCQILSFSNGNQVQALQVNAIDNIRLFYKQICLHSIKDPQNKAFIQALTGTFTKISFSSYNRASISSLKMLQDLAQNAQPSILQQEITQSDFQAWLLIFLNQNEKSVHIGQFFCNVIKRKELSFDCLLLTNDLLRDFINKAKPSSSKEQFHNMCLFILQCIENENIRPSIQFSQLIQILASYCNYYYDPNQQSQVALVLLYKLLSEYANEDTMKQQLSMSFLKKLGQKLIYYQEWKGLRYYSLKIIQLFYRAGLFENLTTFQILSLINQLEEMFNLCLSKDEFQIIEEIVGRDNKKDDTSNELNFDLDQNVIIDI